MKTVLWGAWHVHAEGYVREAAEIDEVLGFYEADDVLAENLSRAFPELHRFATEEELLASAAEGVIVCTATNEHPEVMEKIARAGKHIFTEKVLALTDAEAERIEAAVRENGVRLTISLVQKYTSVRLAVKAVADSGELGKINYMRFRNCHSGSTGNWLPAHFYNREQCGGGAMIDLGAHGMYLTHWILGMPVSATSVFTLACENPDTAQRNTDRVEDNAVTIMGFADGAIAVNETGFVSGRSPAVLEIHGENGYVRSSGAVVVKCTKATEGKELAIELPESLPSPLAQFVTGRELPGCGIEEAKALTHIMEMAYASVH